MEQHDIESESLPAHVSLCQERYRALEHRFEEVETKIDKINSTLLEIRIDLSDLRDAQHSRWNTAQMSLIGVLTAVIGGLLGHIFR